MTSPIVSTDWLTDRLLDPTIKVIEVSSKLGDEAPYRTTHIPGAVNFYWKDLCWHDSDREFVTPGELANRLGKVGISEKDRINPDGTSIFTSVTGSVFGISSISTNTFVKAITA